MTIFLRVLNASVDDKARALLRAVEELRAGHLPDAAQNGVLFEREPSAFTDVPGAPFAYWVSDHVRAVFQRWKPFETEGRTVKQGLATADDFRFLRSWLEVSPDSLGASWLCFAKGGSFSPFYSDLPLVLEWRDAGLILKAKVIAEHGNAGKRIYNEEYYTRPALTWPLRTNGVSFRAMPEGSVFGHKGPAAFVADDSPNELLALCAIVNSQVFGYLVAVQLARTELAQSYEVGLIQKTPVPELPTESSVSLAGLARRAWSLKRTLDSTNETSHAFLLPPGLNEKVTGIDLASVERELAFIQSQIDDAAFTLYGIASEDRSIVESSSKHSAGTDTSPDAEADDDAEEPAPEFGWAAAPIYSWLVGVAFGRFDPRLATDLVDAYRTTEGPPYTLLRGRRAVPPEPEPFDPLPARSPGMWPEDEIPVVVPPDIMVDDPGHNDDLRAHVADAAAHTGIPEPGDLREWLAKEFFPLHIKMYSKSRRKAPIYWQLATPSAGYSVWLYIHAFSKDTLFRVQNDYVAPKLAHEERRLESLASELRDGATAAQRKQLAAQEGLVEELRAFLDEVKRVAPLWKPNLDDGVVINFAPLWRLVPQNKSWQKELKSTWDALCEGKYDWAHLAMHLWPERVVPKCAKDRSLAIAHGLEDVFWVEGTDGKWTARKTPTRSIEELVRERTSPAVKEALKTLIEAPVSAGTRNRRRAI
jgi:hypothetical protein